MRGSAIGTNGCWLLVVACARPVLSILQDFSFAHDAEPETVERRGPGAIQRWAVARDLVKY